MSETAETGLLVLASSEPGKEALEALHAAAIALGYPSGCRVVVLLEDCDVALLVHEVDPWSVVAIDSAAIETLRKAFGEESSRLAPDNPVTVRGYIFVAAPGFSDSLCDQQAKRLSWQRLKKARHPSSPW